MEKRSYDGRSSKRSVVEKRPSLQEEESPTTIKIVLLKDVRLNYTGKATGKLYVFNGAGTTNDVDIKDWETMKNKKRGSKCCPGSVGGNEYYFEIVP